MARYCKARHEDFLTKVLAAIHDPFHKTHGLRHSKLGVVLIPKIIHFVLPQVQSPNQMKAVDLARQLHPTWDIKLWVDPIDPTGWELGHLYGSARSGAQLADLVRLDVVYRYGGIYIDSDVHLTKPLDPFLGFNSLFCSEDGALLTNAVFGSPKHSPIIHGIIEELKRTEIDWSYPPNQTTGPQLFSRCLRMNTEITLVPRETFYPYNWNEVASPPLPTTYGTHLWDGSWKAGKLRALPGFKIGYVQTISKRKVIELLEHYRRKVFTLFLGRLRALLAKTGLSNLNYSTRTSIVLMTRRGLKMIVPAEDLSIVPELVLHGTYEEPELKFLERVLRGGDFVIDVGCNIGIHSLVAAKCVGSFGRVFSIDPNPKVIGYLEQSLLMNWMHERVKVLNLACGSMSGEVSLSIPSGRLGGASIAKNQPTLSPSSTETNVIETLSSVKQSTLDEIFPVAIEFKVLKIDAEGAESDVLRGAEKLLKQQSFAYIMVEVAPEVAGTSIHDLIRDLKRLCGFGYQPYALTSRGHLVPRDLDILPKAGKINLVLQREINA